MGQQHYAVEDAQRLSKYLVNRE